MIRRLLYVSDADMDQDITKNIDDILKTSRSMNRNESVTGFLMYHNGHFMQIIEGTYDTIEQLITNIKRDGRHSNVKIVRDELVKDREFTTWSMGFANLNNFRYYESEADVINFSDLNDKYIQLSKILRVFNKFAHLQEVSDSDTF